jgi:galactokinase
MTEERLAWRVAQVRRAFHAQFGGQPAVVVRAPGRVNLIGEHTDYNDGFVLPTAIDRCALVAAGLRADRRAQIHAVDLDAQTTFGLDDVSAGESMPRHNDWSDYPRGVAWALQERGMTLAGMNALLTSDVPVGAGLSSSAAVEVAFAYTWQQLSDFVLERTDLALTCQRAESEFVGVNCGIMDQFVSRLGERDRCLRIDCRDLTYSLVPVESRDVRVVVCDTGVSRRLSAGEYNRRRAACESAAAKLAGRTGALLREVPLEKLLGGRGKLTEEEYARALHVLRENQRVGLACEALASARYEEAGRLLFDSHESLRDLYEVSCPELDALVEIARGTTGVCGARLTGAGFGGCTVNLVRAGSEGELERAVLEEYPKRSGLEPRVFVFEPGEGARVVRP